MAAGGKYRQNNYHIWKAVLCRARFMRSDCAKPLCSSVQCSQFSQFSRSAYTSDNTAVIVASVFAAMFFILALGLIGYIIAARR